MLRRFAPVLILAASISVAAAAPPPRGNSGQLHPPPVAAAPAPAPAPGTCLDPKKAYDADYLAGRAVWVMSKHGKPKIKVKAETNCIGIDGGVTKVEVEAKGACLAAGDTIMLKRPGNPIQTCRIVKVDPMAAK